MLADNLKLVQERVSEALSRRQESKVTGEAVTLVAVTKNHPAEMVTEALRCGVRHIGENRVQEARHKREALADDGCWHLIGHLQSNKARQAVALFDLIESIDSEHLLRAVDNEAARIGKLQEVLLQINLTQEEQKSGFTLEEYAKLLPKLDSFKNIRVRGLMVIAQKCENIEETRPVFAKGYQEYCALKQFLPDIDILSMGMSNDFTIAIEEGANNVRVGTALFGQRDYSLKF